jgi:hypothetical protein
VTRSLLALLLCALTLALGLWAALVQSENHARARDLAELQRQCEMIEAANAQAQAVVSAHLPGVPDHTSLAAPSAERDAARAAELAELARIAEVHE